MSTTNESTTNESTTNESTTNESTTNESTTNESTTNESTTNESTTNESTRMSKPSNEIYIGKKPLMTYVTASIVQLANEPFIIIKARGLSITRAVDVSQIILTRMSTAGYILGEVKIDSETLQSLDGRDRNVSTIDIQLKKT